MVFLHSCYADAFNWDYEQGEGSNISFFQIDCLSIVDTQDKLLEKISDIVGFSVKVSDLSLVASDDIMNITVSGLYTVDVLDNYTYCESPKKTDELYELIYTFSARVFEFKPVTSLVGTLKAQGAEVFE